MISANRASRLILESIRPLGKEQVNLPDGLDKIVAGDILAKSSLPPFDNSAMDGYALRAKDARGASRVSPKVLQVIEDLPAGYTAKGKIRKNYTYFIQDQQRDCH